MFAVQSIDRFRKYVWHFYAINKRSFVWRNIDDPYKIVVSEIMLQQTQTYRVAQRYPKFIAAFPTFDTLAQATLHEVLQLWQGLGYNRRGKYLHQIAQKIVREYHGVLPNCPATLTTFPGIGKATAASICAFAFNNPTTFIETNIRTVFIYHYFNDQDKVDDKEIVPLIEATLDQNNPREWYYALMDYGVMLKKKLPNPSRKSKHYTIQSKFEGSDRQIRGIIVKVLINHNMLTMQDLFEIIDREPSRIEKALAQLRAEEFIEEKQGYIRIKS